MAVLRGAVVGAGYFSQFHFDAWSRIPEVELVAVCDADSGRAETACIRFGVPRRYGEVGALLAAERLDFVDVVTPPATHLDISRAVCDAGIPALICQKPLAPTLAEAEELVAMVRAAGVRCMVHENFRFQPWHREIRRLLESGAIGRLHTLTFRSRPGDGWGPEAYLARQPYFRTMPRLLVYETGIHFIDTFRFLAGEVERVYAVLRRLNPVIAGEDCGLIVFEFASGVVGLWDANRCNESTAADPRYTFGEFLVEGDGGSIRLADDGTLTVQPLGGPERRHEYANTKRSFGGDCVFATQRHFIDRLLDGGPFETDAAAYLRNLTVEEAVYESARYRQSVAVPR